MFCMLLRKHLLGAKLTEITQPPMERAASFRFDCTDEMGFPVQKTLVAELMGRSLQSVSAVPEGRILDCLRRIGLDESAKRAALPGLMYQPPEPVMKLNLLDSAPEGDAQRYVNILTAPGADVLADRLMDTVGGLSPLVCREAALYAAGSTDARIDSLDVDTTADKLSLFFHEHVSHPAPYYYALPDGTPKQFAFCPIREYGECRRAESFGKLLDMYYTVRDQKDAMRQKGQAVRQDRSESVQPPDEKAGHSGKRAGSHLRPGASAPAGGHPHGQPPPYREGSDNRSVRGLLRRGNAAGGHSHFPHSLPEPERRQVL